MKEIPGIQKPELQALPTMRERISFLYLERCLISRQDNAITVTDMRGTVHVPAAAISVILLGPGSNITHRAMELIGDTGASAIWVGEHGVRYYAHGRPLTHSSRMLVAQAALVSNTRSRLAVARRMYAMRFPDEDVLELTMQQLRGREGARVRAVYRRASKEYGIKWTGRQYNPADFSASDPVNMALSAAHACLYGASHSIITALGCSPGLGFIHTGHERSFVYDIADLYKAEISIPIAFQVAAQQPEDIGSVTRRTVRDVIAGSRILECMVKDIRELLLGIDTDGSTLEVPDIETNVIQLWDDKNGFVKNAVSYGKELDVLNPDETAYTEGYGTLLEEET